MRDFSSKGNAVFVCLEWKRVPRSTVSRFKWGSDQLGDCFWSDPQSFSKMYYAMDRSQNWLSVHRHPRKSIKESPPEKSEDGVLWIFNQFLTNSKLNPHNFSNFHKFSTCLYYFSCFGTTFSPTFGPVSYILPSFRTHYIVTASIPCLSFSELERIPQPLSHIFCCPSQLQTWRNLYDGKFM